MDFAGIRSVLAGMKAAGDDGFEGLTALALNAATGLHFRLSRSGTQLGTDGDGAQRADGIGFECKRYTNPIDSATVKVKLLDLQAREDIDLWVLCATRDVSAQVAREVRDHASMFGLEVQIFDWSDVGGTPLLALLVSLIDPDQLDTFLSQAAVSPIDTKLARTVLDDLRMQSSYAAERDTLLASLDVVSLGFESARKANGEWLVATLSDKESAIDSLRQPLAPLDKTVPLRMLRKGLLGVIQDHMRADKAPATLFLLGEEGVGKSWAPLDAWLELPEVERPMFLFLPSSELASEGDGFDLVAILAKALASQTLRHGKAMNPGRWERMIERWLKTTPYRNLSLVVVVDGINQHKADWGRILRKLSRELEKRHARLIVSSRMTAFESDVKPRFSDVAIHIVPRWTKTERDEILAAQGLNGCSLKPSVADALRNPRLLAIALKLFNGDTLLRMSELTKPQLIFEYLRQTQHDASEASNARDFTKRLRTLAQNLLSATTPQERKKRRILDDLEATAEGRFFVSLDDDPTLYTLTSDGLTLALALAVLDHARDAIRNDQDPASVIAALVEPISTMDDTADVIMAAAYASDANPGKGSENAIAALLVSFIRLQNVDPSHAEGFTAFARKRPDAYVLAAELVWLAKGVLPENGKWLQAALSAIPSKDPAWITVSVAIRRWLRYYAAEYRPALYSAASGFDEHTERQRQLFAGRVAKLTDAERSILSRLKDNDGDIDALARLCFNLLAGRALVSFVPALVDWAFGARLRQSVETPDKDFNWLGNHNPVDWPQTRDAVRARSNELVTETLSRTGKGALVHLNRFSGDSDDACVAQDIHLEILANEPELADFLRREKLDPPEPVDPAAKVPVDIDARTEQFLGVKVDALDTQFGTTSEDHIFETLLPWMARFRPDLAIKTAQAFLADVPGRDGMPLRQGIFASERFALAMTPSDIRAFTDLRTALVASKAQDLPQRDREALAGYTLLVTFPHLDGDQQLKTLLQPGPDNALWLQHAETFADASAGIVEWAASEALERRSNAICRFVLGHVGGTNSPITPAVEKLVEQMQTSKAKSSLVSAFAFLESRGSDDALNRFAQGPWTAAVAVDDAEAYFGSLVLIRAVERSQTTAAAISLRITPEAYGALAVANTVGAALIGDFLDTFLQRIALTDLKGPEVDLEVHFEATPCVRDFINVDEPETANPADLQRFSWTLADYAKKAKREHTAFMAFYNTVTQADAHLALRTMRWQGMEQVFAATPARLKRWSEELMAMPAPARPAVASIALMLAGHMAATSPDQALNLFEAYADVKPFVSTVFDMAGYPLASKVAWSAALTPAFTAVCRLRLLRGTCDHALAMEVAAAQTEGRTNTLLDFIDHLFASGHPARMARALTILGFMDEAPQVESRLAQGTSLHGLAGNAYKQAMKAYRGNKWARHWFSRFLDAPTDAEAWTAFVLLRECVDARYDLWTADFATGPSGIHRLRTGVRNAARRAAGKADSNRGKTLFGQPQPDRVFLTDMHP